MNDLKDDLKLLMQVIIFHNVFNHSGQIFMYLMHDYNFSIFPTFSNPILDLNSYIDVDQGSTYIGVKYSAK